MHHINQLIRTHGDLIWQDLAESAAEFRRLATSTLSATRIHQTEAEVIRKMVNKMQSPKRRKLEDPFEFPEGKAL